MRNMGIERGRFLRSGVKRKLWGFCGGISNYFGIDVILIRILFLASLFWNPFFTLVLYIVGTILTDREPHLYNPHSGERKWSN